MGNMPCNMDNDFSQVFDVDYGYCYTYNPQIPMGAHNITRVGKKYGKSLKKYHFHSNKIQAFEWFFSAIRLHT
jgi:hypothetical protein